jgi:hypothetical protein
LEISFPRGLRIDYWVEVEQTQGVLLLADRAAILMAMRSERSVYHGRCGGFAFLVRLWLIPKLSMFDCYWLQYSIEYVIVVAIAGYF